MTSFRSCCYLFLVLTLVFLHANARDLPKPKDDPNNQTKEVEVVPTQNPDTNNLNPTKEAAPKGNDVNKDNKNFVSFGGVGAAGGIGGVAGVVPIGFIDKGLIPGSLPSFGGLGGGGLGGGGLGGLGGLGGGAGCTPGTGGLVRVP